MTEEIIIDGINVSECVSFDKHNGLNICCYDDTREDKISFANFCVENKDYNFKQLKRAEQKLEKIKDYFKDYIELEPDHLKTDILNIIEGEENGRRNNY